MDISRITLTCLALSLFAMTCFAGSSTKPLTHITAYDDVNTFTGSYSFSSIVDNAIKQAEKEYGRTAAQHILIALDDDNTLTTMPQFLGSVGWLRWQESLLGSKNPALVANSLKGILHAQQLVYAVTKTDLTDTTIPQVLNRYAQQGIHMVVLTDRPASFAQVTQQQLIRHGIIAANKPDTLLFAQTGITNPNTKMPDWHRPLVCGQVSSRLTQPALYQNGILYLAGQNKALGLKCLLQNFGYTTPTRRQYTYIIYIDDQATILGELHNMYHKAPGLHLFTIHFTKYDKSDHVPLDPNRASNMEQQAMLTYYQMRANKHNNPKNHP